MLHNNNDFLHIITLTFMHKRHLMILINFTDNHQAKLTVSSFLTLLKKVYFNMKYLTKRFFLSFINLMFKCTKAKIISAHNTRTHNIMYIFFCLIWNSHNVRGEPWPKMSFVENIMLIVNFCYWQWAQQY